MSDDTDTLASQEENGVNEADQTADRPAPRPVVETFDSDGSDTSQASSASSSGADDLDYENIEEGGGGPAIFSVPVRVQVILGQTRMSVSQLLKMSRGAVVELDRKVGEPVDMWVNDRVVARGEIIIIDDQRLGITLTEVVRALD